MPLSYIWLKVNEGSITKYTMGKCSRKATCNAIECHGNPRVNTNLPPVGRCRKADESKRDSWNI